MRPNKIVGFGFCATLLLILSSAVVGAASSQWFPQVGTNCDYGVSWYVNYTNGTKLTDSTFNVYNDSTTIYYVPTLLDPNNYTKSIHPSFTQLDVGTSLTLRHSYTESSTTVLARSVSLITKNLTLSHGDAWIVTTWFGTSPYIYIANLTGDTVQKQGLFSAGNDFYDYINFAFQPADTFLSPNSKYSSPYFTYQSTSVIAKTESQIVALWTAEGPGIWYNGTYIAEATGRVSSYSYAYHDSINLGDQVSYSVSFVRLPDAIPGYGYEWIVAAIGVGTLVVIGKKRLHAKRN